MNNSNLAWKCVEPLNALEARYDAMNQLHDRSASSSDDFGPTSLQRD